MSHAILGLGVTIYLQIKFHPIKHTAAFKGTGTRTIMSERRPSLMGGAGARSRRPSMDRAASDMMIKCRIPRPNLEELGLVACCFRTQAECEGDRNQKGYCSRLDQAFDQRRAARKASRGGSSAEERELRNTMKAAQREEKKRRRLERTPPSRRSRTRPCESGSL